MTHIYFTDGAVSRNPGKGGFAWVKVEDNEIVCSGGGSENYTTNQRMEMRAILSAMMDWWHSNGEPALDSFTNSNLLIYTDSAYCANCYADEWWRAWERNGWRNSKKQPVANSDLWEKMIPFFKCPAVSLKKVQGHSGDKFNEIVDQMAVSFRLQ